MRKLVDGVVYDMTPEEIAELEASRDPVLPMSDLKAIAADIRWQRETGGIVVNGIPVPTDDRAKVLLMGAASSMADEDTAPYVSGETVVTFTGAQFKALYTAIVAHVAACFAKQQEVIDAIDAGTITKRSEIETAFA